MNTCASTDGARRAQNCAVFASVCIVVFMQLVTVRSRLLKLCVKIYAVFRSHLCIINCSCILGAGCIPFTPPVGDSRLPSAVTDLFTVKILNSLHVETLSANRYRTTKERVVACYQWSYHF